MAASAQAEHRHVTVVINPISGTRGRPEIARQRAALAVRLFESRGVAARACLTERSGHARQLTAAAVADGASLVVAWGGDGTVNEVASVLAFGPVPLAVVPAGSGNGLARELGIPFDPERALACALDGDERVMDAGELDGRLFFNVAGAGLDARVAHRFAVHGLRRRGFLRYLEIAAHELFTFTPDEHTIVIDNTSRRIRALTVVIANGRQYGNGAWIAPAARIDDGVLDVVIVAARSPWAALAQVPKLFAGTIGQATGVEMFRVTAVEITSGTPLVYHVDGEPFVGAAVITGRVHPRALRVRVPKRANPEPGVPNPEFRP